LWKLPYLILTVNYWYVIRIHSAKLVQIAFISRQRGHLVRII
jgi:hypothetical protein